MASANRRLIPVSSVRRTVLWRWHARDAAHIPSWLAEVAVLAAIAGVWFFAVAPFLAAGTVGASDAHWYRALTFDTLIATRQGIFPIYVGTSEYNFTGYPEIVSIGYFGIFDLADFLTFHLLPEHVLYNGVIAFFGILYFLLPYASLRYFAPTRPLTCGALAILFALSPSSLGSVFTHDLYRGFVAGPFIPVVFAAAMVMNQRYSLRAAVLAALCLAFQWSVHAPTGFAVGLFLAIVGLTGLLFNRSAYRSIASNYLICFIIFLLAAAWYLGAMYSESIGNQNPYDWPSEVERSFFVPAIWVTRTLDHIQRLAIHGLLPVDLLADPDASMQLGYGLIFAGLSAFGCWLYRPSRGQAPLVAACALLIVLLYPIPVLTRAVWSNAPVIVGYMDFDAPAEKLCKLLSSAVILLALVGLARLTARSTANVVIVAGLWAFVPWSLWEQDRILKYVQPSVTDAAGAALEFRPDRFVTSLFNFARFTPSYDQLYTHYDPNLFERVIDRDGTVIDDNLLAVQAGCDTPPAHAGILQLSSECVGRGSCQFESAPRQTEHSLGSFVIPANGHALFIHQVDFDYERRSADIHAITILEDNRFYSQIWVREPGVYRMPVYNLSGAAARFDISLAVLPRRHPVLRFSSLCVAPYDDMTLPIRVLTAQPYLAELAAHDGTFLETQLNYLRHFRARINGKDVQSTASLHHRLQIPLVNGINKLEVTYQPSSLMRAGFWLTLSTYIFGTLFLILPISATFARRLRSSPDNA